MWFYLSFLFAVVSSINSIIFKQLTEKAHYLTIALFSLVFSLPFLLFITIYLYKIPSVDKIFWLGVGISAVLNVFAGIIGSIAQAAAFTAFSLNLLGIVTAVFKTSMFFTIIFAWIFFKEKGIGDRLLGSIVMFIGVLLLII